MPSRNPKIDTDTRPSPKARARALKAAAPAKPVAQTGIATDPHMMAGAIISDDGSAHFCDASGRVLRKPVADWIGFMAQRLSFQARQEMARQLNDPALTDEARDGLALDLRRTLRIDALHILTGRADAAFKAARTAETDLPDVPVRRNAFAGIVSPGLIRAVEAHREACQLMLHDPDESDERTAAGVARVTMLGDAIRNFEARTLADLRHKVIYLWSGIMSEVGDTEARDNLISIEGDVSRLATEAQSNVGKAEPSTDLDFTSWDVNGPCPVPTRDQWAEMADTALPWLRLAFAFMCQSKTDLGKNLCEMDEESFKPIFGAVKHQETMFRQIADMADASLARGIVAMEAHIASQEAATETAHG